MYFSLIIPVFNRPEEIDELLLSILSQDYQNPFEIVIVEDGSTMDCKQVVEKYKTLNISYYYKDNSGPGDSRNFGMKNAKGDYFIILDSDCVLPTQYLKTIEKSLNTEFVDCFGGPDKATENFSPVQKAINFSMTSFLTTGGIRGGTESISKFQPRSFNMGISKIAYEKSKGFGNIHPGEDPDLSIRLWELGFQTKLIKEAFVFHKRRIDWNKFYVQINKFGLVRPILNAWHPKYSKITFWFPSVFIIVLLLSIILLFFKIPYLFYTYVFYFLMILIVSWYQNKSLHIAFLSLKAVLIQFYGYGIVFLQSLFRVNVLKQNPEVVYPKLFFKK